MGGNEVPEAIHPVELRGERVNLRELRGSDIDAVLGIFSDPEVTRYLAVGVQTRESERQFLAGVEQRARSVPRDQYELAVTHPSDDTPVGTCRIGVTSRAHRSGDIGYGLRRDQWGRGIATEAVSVLVRFGFDQLGLHRIEAVHEPDNLRSGRLLRRLGFQPEGLIREHLVTADGWRDSVRYALLATDRQAPGRRRVVVVTGAFGTGKTTIRPLLAELLPEMAVTEIDQLIDVGGELVGHDLHTYEPAWPAFGELWTTVIDMMGAPHRPVVFLTHSLPHELRSLAHRIGDLDWIVLDCPDDVLTRRLRGRGESAETIDDALRDAANMRRIRAPVVPAHAGPPIVAERLAQAVRAKLRGRRAVRSTK